MDAPTPLPITPELAEFLRPMIVDSRLVYRLSRDFGDTFRRLGAESADQFLPTPISESILRPPAGRRDTGRYLAIDIGGTNLRVGFIELLADDSTGSRKEAQPGASPAPNGVHHGGDAPHPFPTARGGGNEGGNPRRLRRLLERNWPIQEHLKNENAESLFAWIGGCIAAVVAEGCRAFGLARDRPLPMGVTFSFPMEQEALPEARLMSMGKGFAITSQLDLGSQLLQGYASARARLAENTSRSGGGEEKLPDIAIAAIANDAVSTLVSFIYELEAGANRKAAMGLICGTGCNATLPLKLSSLAPSKRPRRVHVLLPGQGAEDGASNGVANGVSENDGNSDEDDDIRIAVNTEWSINGSAPPLRRLGLISLWDDELSASVEVPGFQPLEYMTAGRYLGELGRLMLVGYMTTALGLRASSFPPKLLRRFEPHNTTFLSHYRLPPAAERGGKGEARRALLAMLEAEFPPSASVSASAPLGKPFRWTEEIAVALYHIAKAIETRAAAIVAAAIVGLLDCAEELPPPNSSSSSSSSPGEPLELVIGYTGGCITNFQDYLADCQRFLDDVVALRYGSSSSAKDGGMDGSSGREKDTNSRPPTPPVRIVLRPCHDGGIKGAGILVPASLAGRGVEN